MSDSTRYARHRDYAQHPLRTCGEMISCDVCKEIITAGQDYYDGGYWRRAHVECAMKLTGDKATVDKNPTQEDATLPWPEKLCLRKTTS